MKTPIFSMYTRRLHHWRMDGSIYFVTWRLAGSQPPLEPDERSLVVDAIEHLAGDRYDLLAYVVMDDHVHVLAAPVEEFPLQQVVHTWKSYTANRLQRDFGRVGTVWQKEYFDRIVRNEDELMTKVDYIVHNPVRRWPELGEYRWVGTGLPCGDDRRD
ncbi:MAG: transposase [Desulfomonile tiedjei]|nr:transposase [Desulfomonile tiedjei]